MAVVGNNAGESDFGILLGPVDLVKTVRVAFGKGQKIFHTAGSNASAGVHSNTDDGTAGIVESRTKLELSVREVTADLNRHGL